ncbi:LacI family DNA-binding transcriptional regulator [Nakamurella endophytica]|uniref:LacI family transcriptional regulator n=1 Tax=Nakamurella endophytica TaxID=1748367 RepID=A0A917WJL5_9ACTN|nr:LacI family DNA-binding transcriptional regulator [Nakamurella endophytica]GGM08346.1 LacI family transcriptional regulator [Nakamurella endophytica]
MEAHREQGRRPTIDAVARAAGVSRALVSFALNGKPGVSAERRAAILAVAEELGYRPDPVARELRTGRSQMFGFIVRNVANPFFNDVLAAMQEAAFLDDVTVVAMDSEYSADRERRHIRTLAGRRVGALAIAPVGDAAAVAEWQALRPGARTVIVNSSAATAGPVSRVAPDSTAAVTLAVEHLVARGHRDIGFLTAPVGLLSDEDRLRTYLDVCLRHGLTPRLLQTDLRGDAIAADVAAVLGGRDRPTAVVTNSDFAAHFVYHAARRVGLRVGADVSVVGHDDLETSALLDPPLTTVRVDRRWIGAAAYQRLAGRADQDAAAPVELVVRGSTAAAPG